MPKRTRPQSSVEIIHGDDGMSWLMLNGTSLAVAAIGKRLTKEADDHLATRAVAQHPTPLRRDARQP